MPSSDLPVDDPVESFWTAPPHHLDDYRSSDAPPSESDVVIIGSGYAGVGTAYHMFNARDPKPSTVMLEARRITSGATGRNGGHVKPDTYAGITRYASLYGVKEAAALQKFESSQVHLVKQLVEKEGLDCDFHLTRGVDAILDADLAEKRTKEYKQLVKDGVVDMKDVAYTPKKDAERVSGVKGAQAAFSFTAAHVWPRKMVHQLLEKLIDQGLQVYAHTPVTEISSTRDERGRWTVTTPRGTIKAKKVVVCTNAYTSSVLRQYKGKIVPVRGVCSHISSPKGAKTPHLPSTYSMRFDAEYYDYLVPRADGSIIVGGAREVFWHDKDSWWDNKNDNELVKNGEKYFDGYMQKYFHGWEDSGAKLDKIWTGIMGYSSDLVPHIGEVPGAPGQYICAGFSGHGMPQILLASQGIAKMVVEDVPYEQTGLPRVFKTSQARLDSKANHMEERFKSVWKRPQPRL
ncbi:uncharacterized protein HMPREF1541_08907 [Cyphellophora europaea CBS 101466]|uniref:FAD dependent oxidoreductase domain-containing protein n=1 Tax=Cyphellophora europaea (strain CBS 101466) TaxID=1220924 RepID=W2RLL5_CYPE1|nr:uncharacterized protein HMPREF1541_08907 [Cyphellophora europaea CBS 101466]ETN36629.1 hypothetical protein HMPREF1541_08907 [Cyphellophora europaea CBS 101466]